jgi:glutamate/tyrosine decarboxylase-like PLP-dependent enzyme
MSLDPSNWDDARHLGRTMIDDMINYLENVRDRPVWQSVPASVKDRLSEPVPRAGQSLESVYETFKDCVLPYPTGNIHPRFWGWVMGTGTVAGIFSELLAATMNTHVAGYDQSAAVVERQVLSWLKELMGFPSDASGVLVNGGTEANLNGLMAARVAKAGYDIRRDGALAGPQLTVYGSAETHSWIIKACEASGLGRSAFRPIAADENYRIDIAACRAAIEADIAAGKRPIAIIGNVGTVNTGAIDDIPALRRLADQFDLWLHVDGAYGALAAWSAYGALVQGQETADSIAFDLHKWGYMPYEIGVALTRNPDAQLNTYKSQSLNRPAYLLSAEAGASADTTYFADRGMQLSRNFKALKAWMSMKEQGVDRIGAAIGKNIEQARYLAEQITQSADLELLAPVPLNVVCFRYAPTGIDENVLNQLNQDILVALQVRGISVPSQTILKGRFAIRVCITNHRSELSDFDILINAVRDIGREMTRVA